MIFMSVPLSLLKYPLLHRHHNRLLLQWFRLLVPVELRRNS